MVGGVGTGTGELRVTWGQDGQGCGQWGCRGDTSRQSWARAPKEPRLQEERGLASPGSHPFGPALELGTAGLGAGGSHTPCWHREPCNLLVWG